MTDVKAKLKKMNFYDESYIERLPNLINNSDDEIKEAILNWLDKGIEKEITINDISLSLLKMCNMSTINAYLTLDWVKKDPEEAIAALKYEFYPVYDFFNKK
jgi:hypothetical protein